MCIYLINHPNLTYTSREHIFPAAIGGIQTLPTTYVSDQANNFFSKIELKALQNGDISLIRSFEGPGSRGSDKKGKQTISVCQMEDGSWKLGYIFLGKPYIVNQLVINKNEGGFFLEPQKQNDIQHHIFEMLNKFTKDSKFCYLKNQNLPEDYLLIGYYDKKFYIASSKERPESKTIFELISKYLENIENIDLSKSYHIQKHTTVNLHLEFGEHNQRFYGKICYNVLAFIKGEEYAKKKEFDKFRNWLLGNIENNAIQLWFVPSVLKNIGFPNRSHICILSNMDNNLIASISLYNQWMVQLIIGKVDKNDFSIPDGLICDWLNKKEYRLLDYLREIEND